MITTVAVEGYRSLRDVVVPLGQLTLVTGPNGSGKSSLYRALRLLADCGRGQVVGSLAREGGLSSVLWAGPETLSGARRTGGPAEGTRRSGPISLLLGVGSDDLGYLVDLGLPDLDGCELSRRLRKRYGPDLVLIAVTGRSGAQEHDKAMASGIDHVLSKPLSLERLRSFFPPRG